VNKHLFVITGASRGIGFSLAEQLLKSNHQVLCISRKTNSALDGKAQDNSVALEQWQQDLADAPEAARRLEHWLGQLNSNDFASASLINNAGVIAKISPLRQSDAADLAYALRVGLEAPMLLSAAFLKITQNWQASRKILNISSGLGRRAMASQAAYCAAKAGMDHFTRCLALDEALTANGAKVCSLAPGVIDTDMQVQLRSADPVAFPDRQGFVALKSNDQLSSPMQTATKVIAYLMHPEFGSQAIADIREITV
jgi:benzil reductase ((S)-benzoin forming)